MTRSIHRLLRVGAGMVLLTALLAVPTSAAASDRAPAPGQDTATATGDNLAVDMFSSTDIEIDAHSGPAGQNPGGTVSFVGGGILPISGPVSCLDVSGNTAVMTVDGPFPSAPGFTAFLVRLVDNGGSGQDVFQYFPDDPEVPEALDCHVGSGDYFGGLLIGRAVVTDANAPTSRKQCRRRGFVQFGFKNQGRCIKYVIHHRNHR